MSLLITPFGIATTQTVRAGQAHWVLVAEAEKFNLPVRGSETYRLMTNGRRQLTADYRSPVPGVKLLPMAEGGPNLRIQRRVRGDTVLLNEPVALYLYHRGAYLVYQEDAPLKVGLVDYDASREPPMERPDNIFQWRFESVPGSDRRDHRTRPLVTREELALINTVRNTHLVFSSRNRELAWRRQ